MYWNTSQEIKQVTNFPDFQPEYAKRNTTFSFPHQVSVWKIRGNWEPGGLSFIFYNLLFDTVLNTCAFTSTFCFEKKYVACT